MKYWAHKFKAVQENEKDVKAGIVAANNHYAGFGAATANMFRMMNDLPSAEWGTQKEIKNITELQFLNEQRGYQKPKQKSLLDYPSN